MRLFLVSLSFILSLLIFQSGFLLKRQEIHMTSKCTDAKIDHSQCWMRKQFKKTVLLVIDALRADFLLPSDSSESPYSGQMPYIHRIVNDKKASVGTIIADPPTTTLQRIKAFTTGTLPTFIDASDNFSPDAKVQEDNILMQAASLGRNVSFFGDDTWMSLFPSAFVRTHPFESFDINDINSVDDAVRVLLRDELSSGLHADLVIAHFLGVDHCGHKYGPHHPQMKDTLRKMDNIISETISLLSDDDLLVVMGDHGMTSTGDHGGDTDDEILAGIMVYSPNHYLTLPKNAMRQIDIVPSLSLLLGIPIPFSNLGTVIETLFPEELRDHAVALNYEQIKRFANTYASANTFYLLSDAAARDATTKGEQLVQMSRMQSILREAWTQFSLPLMGLGLVSLCEVVLYVLSKRPLAASLGIIRNGCLFLQLAVLLTTSKENLLAFSLLMVVLPLSMIYSFFTLLSHIIPFNMNKSSLIALICVLFHNLSLLSNSYIVYEQQTLTFFMQSILIVCFLCGIDREIAFGKSTPRSVSFSRVLSSILMSRRGILLMISLCLLRLGTIFHRCREEEIGCISYYPIQLLTSLSPDAQFWRLILSTLCIMSMNWIVGYCLPSCDNIRLCRSISWPVHISISLHQLVPLVPSSAAIFQHISTMSYVLAQFVYGCTIIVVLICVLFNKNPSLSRAYYLCGAHAITWPLLLLLGDGLQPALIAFIIIIIAITQIVDEHTLPISMSLCVPLGFYLTGHSPTLSSIPWTAAFVGFPGNFSFRLFPAFLVISHVCMSSILSVVILLLHPHSSSNSLYSFVGISSIRSFILCIAAYIHRRHLMVWKIFAPRFIFGNISFIYLLFVANLVLIVAKKMKIF